MPAKKNAFSGQKILLYVAILVMAVIVLYFLLPGSGDRQNEESVVSETTRTPPRGPEEYFEPTSPLATPPEQTVQAPLPPDASSSGTASPDDQCLALAADIEDFFTYLDSQPYIVSYELPGGSRAHLGRVLDLLFANPPAIPEKKGDLFDALKNTAHFYRVLGAKNILLVKDYLDRETGRQEYDLNLFFEWVRQNSCPLQKSVTISLSDLYNYASFFLSTPGGKSYLFRRSPGTSLLVQYFSIRIVDLANEHNLNSHAIDLLPSITATLFRLQSEQLLENQEEYVAALKDLRLKYLNQLKRNQP